MLRLLAELEKLRDKPIAADELTSLLDRYSSAENILEFLRDRRAVSQWQGSRHQLGFFKFVLPEIHGDYRRRLRLHFWERGRTFGDIHDHIAPFASRVISGAINQEIYEVEESGQPHSLIRFRSHMGNCIPDAAEVGHVNLRKVGQDIFTATESYYISANTLHASRTDTLTAVTLIIQESPLEKPIKVFRPTADTELSPREYPVPLSVNGVQDALVKVGKAIESGGI